MSQSELSSSTLRFLGGVYLAGQEHPRVTLRELGKRFDVSAPAISRRATRLIRRGHLTRDGACGLLLTEEGRRIALKAVRKQEVCEAFLVEVVGYSWDEVFPVAWRMAAHLDDGLIERMYVQAGRPKRCPHGQPIPTRDGRVERIADQPLSTLGDGQSGIVSRVFTHDPELLHYLATLHLQPGASVQFLRRAPFNGPIHALVGKDGTGNQDNELVIGVEAASCVYVEMTKAK